MTRPACVDYDTTFTADYLNNTLRPEMDAIGGHYNAAYNAVNGAPALVSVKNALKSGCAAMGVILAELETKMGQPAGAFTSSISQNNPPTGGVK